MAKTKKNTKKQRRRLTNKRRKQQGGNPQIVVKHIVAFQTSTAHPGIFYSANEEKVEINNRVCIIGPRYPKQNEEDFKNLRYPYEECLFFFNMHFPSDYPQVPPHLK